MTTIKLELYGAPEVAADAIDAAREDGLVVEAAGYLTAEAYDAGGPCHIEVTGDLEVIERHFTVPAEEVAR